jgi:glycosyltransferase involved in cell wall biosynthesis
MGILEPIDPAAARLDLTVVMPVYNERESIAAVVRDWCATLRELGVAFTLAVYDDGSTDGTAAVLEQLTAELPELELTRQSNRGHGPTVLRGYREARGEWVAQSDSDGEIAAAEFPALWARRAEHDLILGRRTGRDQSVARKLLSRLARRLTRLAFGAGVEDVNTPCRLMRRAPLQALLAELPETLFAPNVALSGLAIVRGLRRLELPVRFETRRFGAGTLQSFRIARVALRCGRETLAVAWRARRGGMP